MIKLVYLCAMFAQDFSCTPFNTMNACLIAEKLLDVRVVVSSACQQIEVLHENGTQFAPILSPVPRARPSTQ